MNNITIIEFLLVGSIILIQIRQTLKTFNKINVLKSIIPNKDFFKIKLFNIPVKDLQVFQPKDVLENLSKYEIENTDINSKYDSLNEEDVYISEISLINPNETSNSIFEGLLHSINVYLLRNKGATTDFNLIKDITERNIDTEDEDISQRITTPLYLGLMGTMLGIIFGLINLFLVSGNGEDFQIKGFLIGVSIAMSVSFFGLLFTVLNSSYYKTARKNVEIAKNDFYTFIQTELLPILNQSVLSSVFMLHTNLVKFNDNFTVNINRLTGLLNKNYDAVIAQDNILQSLENIDITEFAKANIKVLRELKTGTEDLHKFNQYLSSLNATVDGTTRLSNSFQTLLNKANNFEGLAEKLDSRIEESNKLVQFLNDHYEVLSDRSDLLNDSVKKVDDVLNKSLVELRDHTTEKIDAIKDITIKEEDLMTKAFADNRSHFAKLSLLENLNQSINEIKSSLNSIKEKENLGLSKQNSKQQNNYKTEKKKLKNIGNENKLPKTEEEVETGENEPIVISRSNKKKSETRFRSFLNRIYDIKSKE